MCPVSVDFVRRPWLKHLVLFFIPMIPTGNKEALPSDRVVLNRNDSNNTPAMRDQTAPLDNNYNCGTENVNTDYPQILPWYLILGCYVLLQLFE